MWEVNAVLAALGERGAAAGCNSHPKSPESQEHCRPRPLPQGHALLRCPRGTNLESTSPIHCQWEQLCSPQLPPQPQGRCQGLGRARGSQLGVVLDGSCATILGALCYGRDTSMSLIPAPCPPQEQVVAFSLMFSSFLLPTAWVLSNIYNYRSRPE